MKTDSFIKYVEKTRDPGTDRLEDAISRGICRAKANRFDFKKAVMLAAACAFTLALSFTADMEAFKSAAKGYYLSRNEIMPGAGEALGGYIKNLAGGIEALADSGHFTTAR